MCCWNGRGTAPGADSRAGSCGGKMDVGLFITTPAGLARAVRALLQESTRPAFRCVRAGVSVEQGTLAEGKFSWNVDQAREVLLGV